MESDALCQPVETPTSCTFPCCFLVCSFRRCFLCSFSAAVTRHCHSPGVDMYFLNRATVLNVTSSEQVAPVFAAPPAGLTPTTPVLRHVLQAKKAVSAEKKVLIVIATDGAPTNAQGEVDTAGLHHVLTAERDASRVHVSFVACTDDPSTVAYLNEWDRKVPNLDVVDDYQSEREEILKKKGRDFPFSFGNYIVRTTNSGDGVDGCAARAVCAACSARARSQPRPASFSELELGARGCADSAALRSPSAHFIPFHFGSPALPFLALPRFSSQVKALLGSIDPEFDNMDEKSAGGCCAIL